MITLATIEEIPEIASHADLFMEASKEVPRNYDSDKFITSWTSFILSGVGGIFIDRVDNEIVGALAAFKYPDPYTDDIVATEFFWFTREENRGSGVLLYRAFEAWAKKFKCTKIRMGILVDSMPEKLDVVYRRWGFKKSEIVYVKDI